MLPTSTPPPDPFAFALVGAGKVGTTVASLLREAGHDAVGVASRTRSSARAAAEPLGCGIFELHNPPQADVYLLAVPDAALEAVAGDLSVGVEGSAVLVHFAGALGIDEIARAAEKPGIAALHPVQAFVGPTAARALLPGSAWGVTCSPGLDAWAARLIERDLAGRAIPVAEEDRPLWHAAAVMTSNALAAVITSAAEILREVGVTDPAAVLEPLARGTLSNAVAAGVAAEAITGPVVRGDTGTITRHLAALSARAPDLRPLYVEASRTIVAAARRFGRIDEDTERAFLKELEAS